MSQSQENLQTTGRTEGQTLIHRTFPATFGGPINTVWGSKYCKSYYEQTDLLFRGTSIDGKTKILKRGAAYFGVVGVMYGEPFIHGPAFGKLKY